MLNFTDYYLKSKYYDDSKVLVVDEMKNNLGDIAIEEFVELKPEMYSVLVSHSS